MLEPITPERLNEITVRANAATPGPWRAYTDYEDPYVSAGDIVHTIDYLMDETHGVEQGFRDAQFIAHARTDMEDLVAEVQRLQAEASVVEEVRASWPGTGNLMDVDTDLIRQGWSMPTCYREHEVIHAIAGVIDSQRAEIARLQAAVERVRELHKPTPAPTSQHYYCEPEECDRAGEGDLRDECDDCGRWWPCPTITALDEVGNDE